MAKRESDAIPSPFLIFLKKKHKLAKVTSYDANQSEFARELQLLVNANNNVEYVKRLNELKELGKTFRLTDVKVYETKDEGETMDVRVALQVKGHSITWYFWAPDGKDQYPQVFRDKLYNAAGECHQKVKRGCDLYYRGSNAFHIKTMHHLETEAEHNHNHYRIKDNQPVVPQDLNEHLLAFKEHQHHDLFFESGEIEEICKRFSLFHAKWMHKEHDSLSKHERYISHHSQVLDKEDILEFKVFGLQQEPCRISVEELKLDYEKARVLIKESITGSNPLALLKLKQEVLTMEQEFNQLLGYRKVGGSRGLGSERANTRQLKGSSLDVVEEVVRKDDSLGVVQKIPDWAIHAIKEIKKAQQELEEKAKFARRLSLDSDRELTIIDKPKEVELPSLEKPKESNGLESPSRTKGSFFSEVKPDEELTLGEKATSENLNKSID
jgi:hypothetical protein